jgi:Mitochondrial ribosomal protein subunit L20
MPVAPSMNTRTGKAKGPTSSHIIFNPPASSPNVFHTPLKFLPRTDKRRKLYERGPSLYNLAPPPPANSTPASVAAAAGSGSSSLLASPGTALRAPTAFPAALAPRVPAAAAMPPPLVVPALRRTLTQEDVEEIRRLRLEDPFVWTRPKLAARFGCSNYLVGVIQKSEEAGRATGDKLDEARARWGPRKVRAKRDALRRKELWGRDA